MGIGGTYDLGLSEVRLHDGAGRHREGLLALLPGQPHETGRVGEAAVSTFQWIALLGATAVWGLLIVVAVLAAMDPPEDRDDIRERAHEWGSRR